MYETIQEFFDSRGVSMRVDRPSGVIRGVKILGLESRNGRVYTPQALSASLALYEGAKVNVNHPKGHPQAPRDYQDRIGVIRGVVFREKEGLFGDLHYNPAARLGRAVGLGCRACPGKRRLFAQRAGADQSARPAIGDRSNYARAKRRSGGRPGNHARTVRG